ncbi:MAG: hypothetical protein CVU55_01730 [Deltaproteobacteria bacterium HGW-Deltaproteobacteria-13]|jgi:hypothetical protein|nr:MAG: hypothetical protein CVU55_01730 [Deltaproteobacteria bacterium HGW-Deltaproteobacteria-13]
MFTGRYFYLSFIILMLFPIFVYAQSDTGLLNIDVEGQALIRQNDVTGAREEAIKDALGNAIQTAVSKSFSVPIEDKKLQTVKNAVINEAEKYINLYKILAERKEAETYIVNVNATIVLDVLKNDLKQKGFFRLPLQEEDSLRVFLNVRGLKKYADYLRLKEFLQSVKTVKSVYPGTFAWQHACFEVVLSGNAQSLADELIQKGGYLLLDIQQADINHTEINCMQKEERS